MGIQRATDQPLEFNEALLALDLVLEPGDLRCLQQMRSELPERGRSCRLWKLADRLVEARS